MWVPVAVRQVRLQTAISVYYYHYYYYYYFTIQKTATAIHIISVRIGSDLCRTHVTLSAANLTTLTSRRE